MTDADAALVLAVLLAAWRLDVDRDPFPAQKVQKGQPRK